MTALPVAATVAGAAFVLAAPVVQDVEGVQVPGSITAADRTLTLNGAGLRKKLFTYVPGRGTTVVVGEAEARTRIEGKDFADALFRVWLGEDPVDSDLKDKMLAR